MDFWPTLESKTILNLSDFHSSLRPIIQIDTASPYPSRTQSWSQHHCLNPTISWSMYRAYFEFSNSNYLSFWYVNSKIVFEGLKINKTCQFRWINNNNNNNIIIVIIIIVTWILLLLLLLLLSLLKIKLNPWRYSSEEPRVTEAVAAKWQYMGPCG